MIEKDYGDANENGSGIASEVATKLEEIADIGMNVDDSIETEVDQTDISSSAKYFIFEMEIKRDSALVLPKQILITKFDELVTYILGIHLI